MKTPKEFSDSIKNGVLTTDMLAAVIFSYNKRAKNMRDKAREYREYYRSNWYRYDKYGNQDQCNEKMEEYYHKKDELLALVSPTAIHTVERHRGWDDEYSFTEYYLYYDMGSHSFHHPISETDVVSYATLPIEELDDLQTFGEDVADLLSVQFCDKVLALLQESKLKIVA